MPSGRCDLCDLPLPRVPILVESDPSLQFCCEGCARVYMVARDTGMLETVLQQMGGARPKAPPEPKPRLSAKKTAYFSVRGMWCAGCGIAAERVLNHEHGVANATVSFAMEQGRLDYDPEQVDPAKLLNKLTPLGYRASVNVSTVSAEKERTETRVALQLVAAIAFGMEIMVLYLVQLYPSYALGLFNDPSIRKVQFVVWALSTPIVFYSGSTFLIGAWRGLRARTVGMDTLVALGVLASYFYSAYVTLTGNGQTYFDSASMIVQFILIGRYLEQVGGAQARKDLRSLLRLQPELAWRQVPSGWEQVQASSLASGETILVKPGERVPADARILEGAVTLDESMLTGESLPVTKNPGDQVFAGTITREGALVGQVVQPPGKTRLSQIADIVSRTLSQKPSIQRLADKASTWFTFAILVLAAAAFFLHYLPKHSLSSGLMTAVAVLVVACPCALGLATPLSMAVIMGKAAQKGILIRTPEALETSSSIRTFVFDKTGTLTRGIFSVVDTCILSDATIQRTNLLQMAASVEQFSEHPLAEAITQANESPLLPAAGFVSLRGSGATARLGADSSMHVSVGSSRLVSADSNPEWAALAEAHTRLGETVVWVAVDAHPVGFIALRDQPNRTALAALAQLNQKGIHTVMLSGDNRQTVQSIAVELGIQDFAGGCTPEEKAEKIKALQAEGRKVGMTGDGVNDAPALAQADLSITAAGGSDISGQASDIVLTRSDLTLIPWFLEASVRTRRKILQNLGWAFAYNLVAVPLAMTGLISPIIASITMAISSLIVVINSLALRNK